jgi:hypothetical protein
MKLFQIALCALSLGATAFAGPITWTFTNATFAGGGTVTGSFVYDATGSSYSSLNVTASAGGGFALTSFGLLNPSLVTDATHRFLVPTTGNLTGVPNLELSFVSALTNGGGTVNLATSIWGEYTCADSVCSG